MKRVVRSGVNLLGFLVLVLCLCPGNATAQDAHAPPEGFTAIFNGKDMEGWYGGETRDPSFTNGWGEPRWAEYRIQKYIEVERHWRIEDGELIGQGPGPDLLSWGEYADFEMRLDWKVSADGESGISLRHLPEVKLWDTRSEALRKRGANEGSGGLSRNERVGRFPAVAADSPTGEWNTMYVRMVGPYVTVILNPTKLTDGEREIVGLFDTYLPIEWEIYIQPHLNGLRPDIVLLSPKAGVAVFEIKDWDFSAIEYYVKEDVQTGTLQLHARNAGGKSFRTDPPNPLKSKSASRIGISTGRENVESTHAQVESSNRSNPALIAPVAARFAV